MAEKVTSMRLNEEDLEQFKQFIKDNDCNNQAEAFKALLGMVKLENIKENLGTRGNSIESFRNTVNKLVDFYVNALQENEATEQTIREELQKELSTKDNTISTMYEQLQELKADKINLDNNLKEIESKSKELLEQLQKANAEIAEKSKSIDVLTNNNINQLQQLDQYKDLKSINDKLVKELDQLKADNIMLDNSNKQLQDKVTNNVDMLTFYKGNISKLENEIGTYKADIKALEQQHKQEVAEAKEEATKALEGQQKALQEQYSSKIDVELSKKDVEIQSLQNQIDQLKADKATVQRKSKTTKNENI